MTGTVENQNFTTIKIIYSTPKIRCYWIPKHSISLNKEPRDPLHNYFGSGDVYTFSNKHYKQILRTTLNWRYFYEK